MSVKLTESGVATLLKTLNSLICEEGLLTTEQRQWRFSGFRLHRAHRW